MLRNEKEQAFASIRVSKTSTSCWQLHRKLIQSNMWPLISKVRWQKKKETGAANALPRLWEHILVSINYAQENWSYTRYMNFIPGFVYDMENLFSLFHTKFSCDKDTFILVEISKTPQYLGKDLDVSIKHFHEKALGCCDPVVEHVLVEVYLQIMIEDYRVYVENLSFSLLWGSIESIKSIIMSLDRFERGDLWLQHRKEREGSNSKEVSYSENKARSFSIPISLRWGKVNH